MSKLTVMKYNRIMMATLGIYPYSFTAPSLNRLQSLSPYLMTAGLLACDILASMYAYQETRLSLMLEAIILVIGGSQSLSGYLNMRWKMKSVGQVTGKLQEIVDQVIEQKRVASIYYTVEQNCRQYTKKMITFVLFQQTSFVFAFFFSIYCIYVGNFDTSTYYLPLRLAAPFNVESLYKWYIFWAIEFIGGVTYIGGTVVVSLYFVCCCFYLEALCDHLDQLIEMVDEKFRQNPNEPNERSVTYNNSLNARKLLSRTIDHHNTTYDIFEQLTDINSGTIFAYLVMSAPFLGISLYNLEHSDAGMSLEGAATMIFALVVVFCGLIWPFLLCHYGTYATERIRSIDLTVYNANWIYYPPNLRKYIILIIAQSRSKINFNGFNLIGCTLEGFATICRSSSSYYVIFRRFTQL